MTADVMDELQHLRKLAETEVLVDYVQPAYLGRRLYYNIREDSYYTYDHEHLRRYFGKFPNKDDAKARWRGWLRAGEIDV